jgi:hypothetical protein
MPPLPETHSFAEARPDEAVRCSGTPDTTGCSPDKCRWAEITKNQLLPELGTNVAVRGFFEAVLDAMGPFGGLGSETEALLCALIRASDALGAMWAERASGYMEVHSVWQRTRSSALVRRMDHLLVECARQGVHRRIPFRPDRGTVTVTHIFCV